MNPKVLIFGLLIAAAQQHLIAQTAPAAKKSGPILHNIFIEPSSTSVAGGKARLILTPLKRQPGTYVGDYQLKVTPYFFKSEKGKFSMIMSDQSLLKLTQNIPQDLTGKATTDVTNKTRAIIAKATPSASDRGALTISVVTQNGTLVFNTSYRFGDN